MKKLLLILLLFAVSCSLFQNKQQQAERTVKEYIHLKNPQFNTNDIKFTNLNLGDTSIGVIRDSMIYDSNHRPTLLRTIYYVLNKDLTQVRFEYTD
jgi:hypothetical protein